MCFSRRLFHSAKIQLLTIADGGELMVLEVGDKAPDFDLLTSTGENITMESLAGNQVVLFFYPKDNTPGCTIEACEFRDLTNAFEDIGTKVIGVSPDNLKSHEKFVTKHGLNFPLLVDEGGKLGTAYGAWGEKKFMGKLSIGMKRMTFLVGRDGNIKRVWPKVKPQDHAEEVLKAATG